MGVSERRKPRAGSAPGIFAFALLHVLTIEDHQYDVCVSPTEGESGSLARIWRCLGTFSSIHDYDGLRTFDFIHQLLFAQRSRSYIRGSLKGTTFLPPYLGAAVLSGRVSYPFPLRFQSTHTAARSGALTNPIANDAYSTHDRKI
jgi:hypothetical protein